MKHLGYYGEMKLDDIIHEYDECPLACVIYLMEQYLLEDGIKGEDEYQDMLGEAWKFLRKAREIQN